tara:strand:- start:1868 stop:2263 length:396 start_codon:yes stop_codon:yes gene_type:complete
MHSDNIPAKSSDVGANLDGPNGKHWNLSKKSAPGMALPSNVVCVSGVESGTGHPAAYPVSLPEFFIRAYSDEGDIVFDPFMGSGTTMIAAEKTNRRGFGCEISPQYCDIIIARWEAFTGNKAERAFKCEAL